MWFDTYYSHIVRIVAPKEANGRLNLQRGEQILKDLMSNGIIQIAPLEVLRGKSFEGAMVVLDEAQNATTQQMKTLLTRPEETSRLFVFGDLEQDDRIPSRKLQGDHFIVPSTVGIDAVGDTFVNSHGTSVKLCRHQYLGDFVMDRDRSYLDLVYPKNGFATALLLLNASPNVACTSLDKSDIQRSPFVHDVIALWDRFTPATDGTGLVPVGCGTVSPHEALRVEQAQLPEHKANVHQLHKKTL